MEQRCLAISYAVLRKTVDVIFSDYELIFSSPLVFVLGGVTE